MEAIYTVINNKRNMPFRIKWRMTKWCNYHCEYCKQDKEKFTPNDVIIERAHKIYNILRNMYVKVTMELIGGEIMFYDIDKVLEILTQYKGIRKILLTSNFSAPIEKYNAILSKYTGINLTLSYHDTEVSFEEFSNKLRQIENTKGNKVKVEYVITDTNQDIIPEIIKICEEKNLIYVFDNLQTKEGVNKNTIKKNTNRENVISNEVVLDDNSSKFFTSKSKCLEWINEHGFVPKDFYCSYSLANIEIQGDIIYGSSCKLEQIGHLDKGFERKPIKCTRDVCSICGTIGLDKNPKRLIKRITEENFIDLNKSIG